MDNNQEKKGLNINLPITVMSTVFVVVIAILIYLFPEGTTSLANTVFDWMLFNLDTLFLVGALAVLVFLCYVMFSKFGHIKLGDEKPEFSKVKIFNMLFCASFGASALYWCFTEVMFYYNDPPFGIEAHSTLAAEYGLAYNFFHWGPSAWAFYGMCAIPIIYSFYIKGRKEFRLSAVCNTVYGEKWSGGLTRLIDAIFIFSCFGVCGISLGLAVPLISACITAVTGIEAGFAMSVGVIILISVIFTLSSYVGLGKGMSRVSDANVVLFIIFLIVMFILANPIFTLESILTSLGIMTSEYLRMSTWTDAIDKGGFPQYWTVFYWAYWVVFSPGMAVFIARISKGHRLKDVIAMVLIAGPVGCFIMHGILQSYTMKQQLGGTVAAAQMVADGNANQMIVEILKTTPAPALALTAFVVVAILFMATTLDSNSFTLASVSTKVLQAGDNPSPVFRLYWCLILSIIPLILTLINAELNTLKTIAMIVATPIGILMAILNVSTMKRMNAQFKGQNKEELAKFTATGK